MPVNYNKNVIKIIFFTRLWYPNTYNQMTNQDRNYINQMGIEIMEKLKGKSLTDFIGGIKDLAYAKLNINTI